MIMKYFFGLVFFLLVGLFSSCGGDDISDCTAAGFNEKVNATINDLNAAGTKWANDPTESNCKDYKKAADKYLDAVEDFDGCADISQADYDQALDNARAAVASITCN
jgi:hypothetical protein